MENNNKINENNDYVICQICGFKSKRIYGQHLKSHGITSEEYKKMFPDSPLYCSVDGENTSKNSGKHMKDEKYKKMFSEKIKGDKNPNHKSKTTLEKRQQCSPFSKKFVNYENEKEREDFIKNVCDNKTYTARIDYWINKGYSEDESIQKLKERQTTFTLDKCVEKYGETEGVEIYTNRQKRWQYSLNNNGNLKQGYSKISQILFYKILDLYNCDDKKYIYFATKNEEYRLNKKDGGVWIYDFVDLKNKKIIEYNGDEYHANPKLYKKDDYPHPFRKNITAQDIWNKDKRKIEIANEKGFEVMTIWDSEFKKNKDNILNKCFDFLNIKK